ncbi:MAG: FAD-binding oxidoreductase [Candidatus Rokubacteria bacterium]|nr:FAD-binding oxidoreductase [Candidatus Rokubacteria bacterium]
MAVSATALTDGLIGILGSEGLLTDPATLERCAVDGLCPRWVARPATAEDLSRLLHLASDEDLAVIPRGNGGRMALGNVPTRVDLMVELSRLSQVLAYEPDDLTVTVQAGISLDSLAAQLTARRQFLPLDPLVGAPRTVGGVLAVNDFGPLRFRYGTARDLLLGVRFAQADGTLTWGGARVVKSVTGYDIPKLLVGSLGSLGILIELALRLHSMPEAEGHWLVCFASAEKAGDFLALILDSALEPSRLELVNGAALDALGIEPFPAAVGVSVGSVAEAVRSQGEALADLARRCGAERHAPIGPDLWQGLGRALTAEGDVLLKVSTLPALTADRLGMIAGLAGSLGLRARVAAEAGSGVLHASLTASFPAEAWERDVIGSLRERVAPEGGSVVAERAPAGVKARLDVWGPVEPAVLTIMKRLKAEFDPRGILNPGRFVDRI